MYVDDIKLARKKQNINPTWKILMKDVDLGEPTSFIDHVYLGCTQPECQRSKDIVYNYRCMWNWQWPSLDYRQRDHRRAREAQGQVHHWTTRNWNPRECDSQPINTLPDSRQSGGSARIPSLTGYEPKTVQFKDIDAEAIEPEDVEPRRTELDKSSDRSVSNPRKICEKFSYWRYGGI